MLQNLCKKVYTMISSAATLFNVMERSQFVAAFENVVEHTPKVAEQLYEKRPFRDNHQFLGSLDHVIDSLSEQDKVKHKSLYCSWSRDNPFKVTILVAHPDLAGKLADQNLLTPESTFEQREAGLHLLTVEQKQKLKSLNDAYRDKFGFTFIICARENKAAAILEGLTKRLVSTREEEIKTGIGEVKKIARLRAVDILKNINISKL